MGTEISDKYKEAILRCFTVDDQGNLFKSEKVSKFDSGPLGKASERLRKDGYKDLRVHGKRFLSHRVVWLLKTGDWPNQTVDHKNYNRADNRFENLQDVPYSINVYRSSRAVSGKSQYLGVKATPCGNWVATLSKVYLGYFKDEKAAALAYNKAALDRYGEFARLNEVT